MIWMTLHEEVARLFRLFELSLSEDRWFEFKFSFLVINFEQFVKQREKIIKYGVIVAILIIEIL